jgi:hypothetical protein
MSTKYEEKSDTLEIPVATINEVEIGETGNEEAVIFSKQLIRKVRYPLEALF